MSLYRTERDREVRGGRITQLTVRAALWSFVVVLPALWCLVAAPAEAGLKLVGTRAAAPPINGLDEVLDVALSPDGVHLYAANQDPDSIVVFSIDPLSGTLTFVEQQIDNVGGVDGLEGIKGIALSPDGAHLYAVGRSDYALAVFARNPSTGALTFVEMKQQGVGGVDGLEQPNSVAVSGDGKHVYVAGDGNDTVGVFSRNPTTGALTFVEVKTDGVGGVDGLSGAQDIAISPTGNHVYVTGYIDDAVAVFSRNPGTGALTFVEMKKDGIGGVDGLDGAVGVTVSPDGKNVYTVALNDNAVAVFQRNPGTGALTFVEMEQDGVGGVTGMQGARHCRLSADAATLYVTSDSGIVAFSRDTLTGTLTFVESIDTDSTPFAPAASSASGTHLYAGAGPAVLHFRRNGATGRLRYVDGALDTGTVVDFDGPSGISLSSGPVSGVGHLAYVTAANSGSLNTFRRGPLTGQLYGRFDLVGFGGAEAVAMLSSGEEAFVAASADFSLSRCLLGLICLDVEFDGVSGADGLYEARSIVASPDDAHVYVVGRSDAKIGVYKTNGPMAGFSFVEVQEQGVGGVDGLNLPWEIAISPDGAHLYVTSYENGSVAVFERNAVTGKLTFVEVKKDGVGGVDGLEAAGDLTVSPDGAHVYVTGANEMKIAKFSRNPSTGALTFLGTVDGTYPFVPRIGPIKVSPDGNYVYQANGFDNFLLLYKRNATTGDLTPLTYTTLTSTGFYLASDLAVSSDNKFVYVTGRTDDEIAIFAQSCGDGIVDAGEQCDDGNLTSGDCCSSVCEFESATCSTILGKLLAIKDPAPGVDPSRRTVTVKAIEPFSPDVLSGNPVAAGAVLEIAANGDSATRQSFFLPPGSAWSTLGSQGFKYSDSQGTNGPVKSLLIKKSGSGKFLIKAKVSAATNPVSVVPPNVGTDGGLKLSIPGGGTYCVRLGGSSGGLISANSNDADTFKIKSTGASPTSESTCP